MTATLTVTRADLLQSAREMLSRRRKGSDKWFDGRQLCDHIWMHYGDDRTLSGIVQHLRGLAEAGHLEVEGGGRQGRPVRFRFPEKGAGHAS
jgi:hypothetical protein